jgi:hypothetical protein
MGSYLRRSQVVTVLCLGQLSTDPELLRISGLDTKETKRGYWRVPSP